MARKHVEKFCSLHYLFSAGVADPDPHHFGKPDPDPHWSESWIRIGIRVKIQELWMLKMEERPRTLPMEAWNFKMEPRGFVDQWSQIRLTLTWSRIQIGIRIKVKSWIRVRIKVKRDTLK
jgi:hypothetical protein